MLLIAAVASLLRGERYVHVDAMAVPAGSAPESRPDTPPASEPDSMPAARRHQGVGVAVAREAAALDGIPDQDVAFEEALAETEPTGQRSR
jgi:hypothetical protein